MYIVSLTTKFPDADVVPWFLSSDACEQLFAFLRTGRYCGRRTNLDALTVLQGMSKKNRTLTLDEEGEHMLEHTIAHTRGRTLLSGQEKAPHIYKGSDITLNHIKLAIIEGANIGRKKFNKHTCFSSYDDDKFLSDKESDDDDDSDSEDDDEHYEIDIQSDDDGLVEFSNGKKYHERTAIEKFCNDGKSRMPGQTRFKRFRATGSERLTLDRECSGENCNYLAVGETGWFVENTDRKILIRGQVLFLACPSFTKKASEKSSVNYDPVNKLCTSHTKKMAIWIKSNDGKIVLCNSWKRATG